MLEITSSSNNKCKYVKSLSQKKSRQKYGEYTIEGIKSVSDALNSEREITALYVSESFFENEKFERYFIIQGTRRRIYENVRYKSTAGHTCGCENRR